MVIFGAGASYDCASSRPLRDWPVGRGPHRLPLAKQLFDDTDIFNKWINTFPRCREILSRLREASQDGSVESELERLRAEGKDRPDRLKQLAAVQFYLQLMLWECQDNLRYDPGWAATNNYVTLLDQIESWRKEEEVYLITFNYDTMLEDDLRFRTRIKDLPDYI